MNYLAIDTSGAHLTIIFNYNGETYQKFIENCALNHSVTLMPKMDEIIKENKIDLTKLDFLACVVGAGSFTGIRIGVATIKAMAFALNKPVVSITSFDVLAYNKKGKNLAVIDAKHNSFYACGYNDFAVTLEPNFISKEELLRLSLEYTIISGSLIDGVDTEVVSLVDGLKFACEEKGKNPNDDVDSLVPLYVRKSQAEEGR